MEDKFLDESPIVGKNERGNYYFLGDEWEDEIIETDWEGKPVYLREPEFTRHSEIYKFLGMYLDIEYDNVPYSKETIEKEEVLVQWPSIIIPREGIEKMIQDKISDKPLDSFKELKMLVEIPYMIKGSDRFGIWHKNVSIEWRGDKCWKYGDITKSRPEFAYYIESHALKTNDYYILSGTNSLDFIRDYIMKNQWGLGSSQDVTQPADNLDRMLKESELYSYLRRMQYGILEEQEKKETAKE